MLLAKVQTCFKMFLDCSVKCQRSLCCHAAVLSLVSLQFSRGVTEVKSIQTIFFSDRYIFVATPPPLLKEVNASSTNVNMAIAMHWMFNYCFFYYIYVKCSMYIHFFPCWIVLVDKYPKLVWHAQQKILSEIFNNIQI